MKNKSPVRQEIEKILKQEFKLCFIDGWTIKKTYRMKLVTLRTLTEKEKKRIEKLPHVIKTGRFAGRNKRVPDNLSGPYRQDYSGIAIYFDCKPSLIEL